MITNSEAASHSLIVAIDGPAGAGKSTVAAHLANRFGLLNLETGGMYRALALKAQRAGVPCDSSTAMQALTQSTSITLQPGPTGNVVLLDGEDVTGTIRGAEVTVAASRVSVHGPVRQWMVAAQRSLARLSPTGIVMEGRDIGTVVFPEADLKIFLDASLEARGDRRFAQQPAQQGSLEAVLRSMRDRDDRDRSREQSPLQPAEDAVLLNTTTLSLDQVLSRTEELVAAAKVRLMSRRT